jgi:hypothetical protein
MNILSFSTFSKPTRLCGVSLKTKLGKSMDEIGNWKRTC